ncbi:MAG: Zn-dependent alcohol dehydrogenase [Chloroflexota bacterium]|nr:MAG: Zn-dependent alcohol dehydrogenase [Chloroflexota bacterium]
MKAAVLYEAHKPLVIEDVTIDGPRDGEVLARVVATGACHSDYHVMDGSWHGSNFPMPVVLGHEAAGIVEKVGPGVTSVKPGDHVIMSFAPSCGRCKRCSGGQPHLCQSMSGGRGTMYDGSRRIRRGNDLLYHFGGGMSSFAELSLLHESQAVKVRKDIQLDRAALIGCAIMTGVGAVLNTARVEPGATMAVFGTGGVGLSVVQGGVLANASRIIAVDLKANKLAYAREMGATDTINASDADPVDAIKEITGGQGVDYAFDAIGFASVSRQCYDVTRRGGTTVVVGMAPTGQEIPIPATIPGEEKIVKGCFYGSTRPQIDFPRLVDFYLAGKLKIDQMLTRRYKFDEINESFDALHRGDNARGVIMLS